MNNISLILIFLLFNLVLVYDLPEKRKIHKVKTPLIGGYLLILNLILFSFLIIFNFYSFEFIAHIFISKLNFYLFIMSLFIIFCIGAVDDKINLNPNLKLLLSFSKLLKILKNGSYKL